MVQQGVYRHYKGGEYFANGFVKHTETGELLVLYRSVESGETWVRPAAMFFEFIMVHGKPEPRFKKMVSRRRIGKGPGT